MKPELSSLPSFSTSSPPHSRPSSSHKAHSLPVPSPSKEPFSQPRSPVGLYDPSLERDACGVGLIASLSSRREHSIVENALEMLERMDHRGACGCNANDG
eukprot:UC4_evm1s387